MPLIKSASKDAVSENIRREVDAGRPQKQAVAIALDVQRRAKKADGGPVKQRMQAGGVPFYVRSAAHGLERSGMIHSLTSGRSDRLPIGVKANSFVIPADVVSGIGQGNSMAGGAALSKMFGTAPGGAAMPHPRAPAMRMPSAGMMQGRRGFADGGDVAMDAAPVDIMASGGEFVVPAEKVAEIGGGDMDHGHSILDAMVKHIRKKTIKALRKLPAPKKN